MATFTVSATGGNWSSTATWVGGVLPAVGDDIVANATSGPLTVDSNRTCLTINFTGYTNTFTINNGVTLTVSGTSITLDSGMTYDQTTTGILSTTGNQTAIAITFGGITIPNLTIGKTTAGTTQTVTISGSTPTVKNLVISNGASNANTALAGTGLTITNSLISTLGPLTGTVLTFSGVCTISASGTSATISNGFTVTTGSSLQLLSTIYIAGGTITFSGTATLNPGLFSLQTASGAVTFNTGTVTWYNVNLFNAGGVIHTLLSALNISNNLTVSPISAAGTGFAGGFSINVSGSFIVTLGNSFVLGTGVTPVTLNMLGTGTFEVAAPINSGIININGSGNYVLGSAARPNLSLAGNTFNLVGTSTANVYSTTGHTLSLQGVTLDTNRTAILGGSQIIWGNISLLLNNTNTLTNDTIALGNLSSVQGTINTGKLYVAGNLSVTTSIGGTSTIELDGSNNTTWGAGTYQNSIIVNKSGVATVTITGAVSWGAAGRTFNINTGNNLILSANLTITAGTMTFLGTATLTPNLNTLFLTTTAAKTLNTSTVTWYNVTNNTLTTLVTLTSNLNISNNLSFTNTLGSSGCGFTGNFNVNVSGSLLLNDIGTIAGIQFTGGGSINMIGTGTIRGATPINFTLNINTPTSYVIGDATFPTTIVGNPGVINLQGTSVVSVYSATGHTLTLNNSATINTNNTPTGANLPGGTQILWGNISTPNNSTIIISQPITAQGNLTSTTTNATININGAKVIVFGNLSYTNNSTLDGTSQIELGGSGNSTWFGGNYRNNININKTGIGVVTLSGTIAWGAAGRTLSRTAGSINPSTSTISIPAVNCTINDMTLWNLIIPGLSTITQNVANTIQNDLTLAATNNVTFAGTAGWTCANLICSTAGRTITLQSLVTYTTTTSVNMLGSNAQRILMRSSDLTIPYDLAIWTFNGNTQSMVYVSATAIDSSLGQTIWSFQGTTNGIDPSTQNWNPGTKPETQGITFVN